MEDTIEKIPLHQARDESDSMCDDVCKMCGQKHKKDEMCVPQAGEKERMAGNIEGIATAIMEALDAVDADENTRISSIMIEIGLE